MKLNKILLFGLSLAGCQLMSADDATAPSRNLSFDVEHLELTLGQTFKNPVLSGNADGVTYSSSNPEVADVTDRGGLFLRTPGETVITASTGNDASSDSESVSYSVTVVPMFPESEIIEIITENGGEIENKIKSCGVLRPDAIKVSGPIDSSDLIFIKSASGGAANLVYLDLSEAYPVNSEEAYVTKKVSDGIGMGGGSYAYILSDYNETVYLGSESTGMGGTLHYYKVYTDSYDFAFENSQLRYLALPESMSKIGERMCKYAQLEAVSIPASVESIGNEAFSDCRSLNAFSGLSDHIKTIGNGSFNSTLLMDVSWLANVEEIGELAFYNNMISQNSLSLPSLKTLGRSAFADNSKYGGIESGRAYKGLYGVEFGDNIRKIGGSSFLNCPLQTVKIGQGIEEIEGSAFAVYTLEKVEFESYPKYVGQGVFAGSKWYAELPDEDGLIYLGDILWGYADNLETKPSVLNVKEGTVTVAGGMNHSGLTDFSLPESLKVLGGYFFNNENIRKRVNLPAALEYVGDWAFNNAKRLSFGKLPESMEYIGRAAFQSTEMPEIHIGSNVKFIGYEAFNEVASLSVYYNAPDAKSHYESFTYCFNVNDLEKIEIGPKVETVPPYIFHYAQKADVIFPEKMDSELTIGNGAFTSCAITSLHLPEGTIRIDDSAFSNCEYLTDVILPEGLKELGDWALSGCDNLLNIELPESLEIIKQKALQQSGFKTGRKLTISAAPREVGWDAFYCFPQEVVCKASAPFDFFSEFDGFCIKIDAIDVTVKVPEESLDLYLANPQWNCYNLVGDADLNTAVGSIEDSKVEIRSIHTIEGIYCGNNPDALTAGRLYIITTNDGKVMKVMK